MRRAATLFCTGLLLAFALVGAIVGLRWQYFIQHPLQLPQEGLRYVIKPGTTFSALSTDLARRHVLSTPRYFIWLARFRGQANHLKAGEYWLRAGTTPSQLLEQLTSGEVIQHPFLIVEGQTFQEVRTHLEKLSDIKHVLANLSDEALMLKLGISDKQPEGYFFPDTYFFSSTTTDLEILEKAHQKMLHVLYNAWASRRRDLPYHSPYEALVMASLIEKETAQSDERPKIAGVLINRLEKNMYLQVDPTVIYGLGIGYRGELSHQDLQRDTPFNTYLHRGLPLTPIALPSKASIVAALNPVSTKDLYYVANGDGTHTFSSNLEEHNKAVQKYLQKISTAASQ